MIKIKYRIGEFKMKTIKQKMMISISSLLVAVSIVSLITGIFCTNTSISITVNDDLKSIGQIADVAIKTSLEKYSVLIESIASQEYIGDPNVSQEKLLENLERENQKYGFESLLIADDKGTTISTDKTKTGKNIGEYDAFKQAMAGKTIMSTPQADVDGKIKIFVNTKVSNSNGYKGILSATLDSQLYSNIIKDITINKSGVIFMLDNKGTFIANKQSDRVEQQINYIEQSKTNKDLETAARVYKNMIAGKTDIETYDNGTGNRLCYYKPIEGTDGWSFGIVVPKKEMTSSLIYTIIGLSVLSVISLIIGLFITIKIANSIANPISKMSKRLEKLSEGDITSDIEEIKSKDEVGTLYKSLSATVLSLRNYITEISSVLGKISNGDLHTKVEHEYIGDFSSIKDSMEKIITSLNYTMTEIKNSSDQIANGSEQVASGSQALAQGATEQASSIQELSATISTISDHVKNNAQNAVHAKNATESSKNAVLQGNEQMQDMIKAMAEISSTSNQISKIIKTIDDIAFQTNILALNAAVEAARAGSAGKGFAVVAEEVRNLASKSAQAAKNTTDLIESSIAAVESGKHIADQTATSLKSIVESSQESAQLINQIALASNEQANSISQITQGVEQIASVVQTNSATAEESAAASEELSSQAQILNQLMSQFNVNLDNSQSISYTNENQINSDYSYENDGGKY